MDVKWTVDEAMCAYRNGGTKEGAANAILNALAMSETEVMGQYMYAKNALCTLFEDEPEKKRVLCGMIDEVVQDEGDHDASFKKAAAIIGGYKPAKPHEYDNSLKGGKQDA